MNFILEQFIRGATAKGARSSALHALQWVLGLLLAAVLASIVAGAEKWVLISIGAAIGLVLFTFLGAYIFLLRTDRDALRSENYAISKMAIDRGLIGDDLSGFIDPADDQGHLIGDGQANIDVERGQS